MKVENWKPYAVSFVLCLIATVAFLGSEVVKLYPAESALLATNRFLAAIEITVMVWAVLVVLRKLMYHHLHINKFGCGATFSLCLALGFICLYILRFVFGFKAMVVAGGFWSVMVTGFAYMICIFFPFREDSPNEVIPASQQIIDHEEIQESIDNTDELLSQIKDK